LDVEKDNIDALKVRTVRGGNLNALQYILVVRECYRFPVFKFFNLYPINLRSNCTQIIAVHAFTQESQPHDAVQKLEDLDAALKSKEASSISAAVEVAALFSCICARQPRSLQICVRLLERAAKQAASSATDAQCAVVYCYLGQTLMMQGAMQYERSMKAFREATRRDPNNAAALEGMILCQLYEGAVEDAESQIELLTLMHSAEELGHEFAYLRSFILRGKKEAKNQHIAALNSCKEMFLQQRRDTTGNPIYSSGSSSSSSSKGGNSKEPEPNELGQNKGLQTYLNTFQTLLSSNPDFTMLLATDFFGHMEATTSIASCIPSTNSLLQGGSVGVAGLKGQLQESNNNQNNNNQNNNNVGMMTLVGDTSGLTDIPGSPSKGGASSGDNLTAGVEISRAVQYGLELVQMVRHKCCS
jgi:tetratricopeptide (TPR) repeat protein